MAPEADRGGEKRYLVRLGERRGGGIYYRQPHYPGIYEWRAFAQRDACRMTRAEAEEMRDAAAKPTNGGDALPWRIVRLISRAEAVERASRGAYLRALEDVASMLDRCAQTQDHAAWEAAQAGLTALVAKHETVAGSYRLAARSAREMGR